MTTDVFHHSWLGGLFSDPELFALLSPEQTLKHMLRVEAEFLRAQGKVGTISLSQAEEAANAVEHADIDVGKLRSGMVQDGVVVPELAKQLRHLVGPEQADLVHSGLTSQDVIDTALVLSLQDVISVLDRRIERLAAALGDLSSSHGENTIMGRTRMQAAEPIIVADRIKTWCGPLTNNRQRLVELSPRLLKLQLGGAVGDRAAFGINGDTIAVELANALELSCAERAWHAERDPVAEFAGWLSLVSGTLGKMGQDIALMAQQGVDEIVMTGGGGSSAMPHKQNPVVAETLVALSRFNATQLSGMHHAMVHEQERSGAAWMLEWMILPQMILTTGRGLVLAHEMTCRIERIGNA